MRISLSHPPWIAPIPSPPTQPPSQLNEPRPGPTPDPRGRRGRPQPPRTRRPVDPAPRPLSSVKPPIQLWAFINVFFWRFVLTPTPTRLSGTIPPVWPLGCIAAAVRGPTPRHRRAVRPRHDPPPRGQSGRGAPSMNEPSAPLLAGCRVGPSPHTGQLEGGCEGGSSLLKVFFVGPCSLSGERASFDHKSGARGKSGVIGGWEVSDGLCSI